MWLITPIGFFSIVQKPGDSAAGTLTIRARAKGDLEVLRDNYLSSLGPVIANAGTDYRYRAQAPRKDIADAMLNLVAEINYDNFKNEVQKRQGSARAHTYHKVWDALCDIAEPETSHPSPRPGTQKRRMARAFGGILIDEQDRILLVKPRDEYDGYAWTFPKGHPDANELPEHTALREVLEETGYDAAIVHRLPEKYVGGTTMTDYFLMNPSGAQQAFGHETEMVCWATLAEAEKLIGETRNTKGRGRDLKVLRDVSTYLMEQR
jgi:ADP-ribose pyrophosphatase YjhB (NUDIX family)